MQCSDVITPVDTVVKNFLILVVHVLYSSGEQEAVRGLHLARQNFWHHIDVATNHVTAVFLRTLTLYMYLSFRRVLNVICSFLGNSPASEF